jgi:aminopeptidase N
MKYLFLFVSLFTFSQQTKFVDFKSVLGQISVNPIDKTVSGEISYDFDVLKPIDTIKIDAQNMTFNDLKLNGNPVVFFNTNKELQLLFPFKKGKNKLTFSYWAKPKQTLYFIGSETTNNLQIWTQGQGKYTSHWFPSFDDVNEKVIFNLNITYDKRYEVISNGILESKSKLDELLLWKYRMKKPMSSYLLMLTIGQFEKQIQKSNSGIPLEFYLRAEDHSKFEPTYRYSKVMFDFLEKEIGVKYPWSVYRQAPVRDFLYAGMENTAATLFATRYVVDSIGFEDRSYTNINAHELAHQWFGNLVTAQSGKHHWLQEGFATYYALLAEKEIYGEAYFYNKLFEYEQHLKFASRSDRIPVLNAKASSLTFYEKGAWALFVLHSNIGDKAFKKAVKKYLKKHSFQTVSTPDFLEEVHKVSNYDLEKYSKVWLEDYMFNSLEASYLFPEYREKLLTEKLEQLKRKPLIEKKDEFEKWMQSDLNFVVKERIISQLVNEEFEVKKPLLELALQTNNVQIRQTIARTLSVVPEEFRLQYETLLDDKSYQTQEITLFNLWNSFPEHRFRYLDKTKKCIGFNDFNLKILWLSLALSTSNYTIDKNSLVDELVNYTSLDFEAPTRQNALEKLITFKLVNDIVLKNLVNATTHHMWQFSKFGRETIRNLIKSESMRISFERILPELNATEQFQLNRLLKE